MNRRPVSHEERPPNFLAWAFYGLLSWVLAVAVVWGLIDAVKALGGLL